MDKNIGCHAKSGSGELTPAAYRPNLEVLRNGSSQKGCVDEAAGHYSWPLLEDRRLSVKWRTLPAVQETVIVSCLVCRSLEQSAPNPPSILYCSRKSRPRHKRKQERKNLNCGLQAVNHDGRHSQSLNYFITMLVQSKMAYEKVSYGGGIINNFDKLSKHFCMNEQHPTLKYHCWGRVLPQGHLDLRSETHDLLNRKCSQDADDTIIRTVNEQQNECSLKWRNGSKNCPRNIFAQNLLHSSS